MNLAVNVVIEWLSDGSRAHLERVLFIDPSGTDMVTIDIDPENKKALPIWRKCEEISVALAACKSRLPFQRLCGLSPSLNLGQVRQGLECFCALCWLIEGGLAHPQ